MTDKIMREYRTQIETALEKYLPVPDEANPAGEVIRAMRYSLFSGGKRIRPVLTMAFCALCGGSVSASLPFACAIEMVQTYSLIHDDMPCMDDDDMRRGKPSNHKVFGEDIALLAGDGLLTKAFEAALSAPTETAAKAALVLSQCIGDSGMVGGQCIDLKTEGESADLALVREMYLGKTVALISAACQMGCIAAGASQDEITAAAAYAEGLGMAFQIRDDILDVTGSAEKLGKNVGMDSAHDKRNFVSLLGVEKSQALVEEYTENAVKALDNFDGDSSFLKALAISLAAREA